MVKAILLMFALGASQAAPAPVAIDGARLQAAAIDCLRVLAKADGVDASFLPAGPARGVSASSEDVQIEAKAPANWLRTRIPVSVRVSDSAGRATTSTVWIAASALRQGPVYASSAVRGLAGAGVRMQVGEVDLARTHGAVPAAPDAIGLARLRRAVTKGEPALASDFEPMPMVLAQQAVRIESGDAGVRLSVAGVALTDGSAGELIDVRWSGADRPIRARVVSREVVTLEH